MIDSWYLRQTALFRYLNTHTTAGKDPPNVTPQEMRRLEFNRQIIRFENVSETVKQW